MIPLVEKVIRDKYPELSGVGRLSFLKLSTPSSGKSVEDKVIFLVFNSGSKGPFLCVKTVRGYAARSFLEKSFNNLRRLHGLVRGTKSEGLFPCPLHFYDDGENVFALESACPGWRLALGEPLLKRVVGGYSDFQVVAASVLKGNFLDVKEYAKEALSKAGVSEPDAKKTLAFLASLPSSGKLPRVIQHGDLTEDNLLFTKDGFCILDCDYAGLLEVPGFDLFTLFARYDSKRTKKLCELYLPEYFRKIGAEVEIERYRSLYFLYQVLEKVLRKGRAEEGFASSFVADFKKSF